MTNSAILDDLARASAVIGDLIDRIAGDQWTAPTPCTEWSVRDVVNHLVGMNLVFVAMFEETPMPERGADRLGADPAGAGQSPRPPRDVKEPGKPVGEGSRRLAWWSPWPFYAKCLCEDESSGRMGTC